MPSKSLLQLEFSWNRRRWERYVVFCLKFQDYQDTDARKKNIFFPIKNPSTGAVFLIEILMEEIKLMVAEN